MKKAISILFLLLVTLFAFGQGMDTAHVITIKVRHSELPLRCVYSHSNTLYTNVTNILVVNYSDSASGYYEIETDLAYTRDMKRGRFLIVKHHPGTITVSVYRNAPNKKRIMVSAQEFTVKNLPNASLVVGGTVIDSTASVDDLLKFKELTLSFGDFMPMDSICTVKSFDLKVDSAKYHSDSNLFTKEMIGAIAKSTGALVFENVKAIINSPDDVDQTISKDGKHLVYTQRVYSVEEKSKPIKLIRE